MENVFGQTLVQNGSSTGCGGKRSRPDLHSCGFWFPTRVRESEDMLPVRFGWRWLAGIVSNDARWTAGRVGLHRSGSRRESGAKAVCVAGDHGKGLGRVCFLGLDVWMVLLSHPPFPNHTGHPCPRSVLSVVSDLSVTRTSPLCPLVFPAAVHVTAVSRWTAPLAPNAKSGTCADTPSSSPSSRALI